MELGEYRNIYQNEESHFFYVSTHYLVAELVRRYTPNKRVQIPDAGCGTGGLLHKLTNFGKVVGVDFSSEAIRYARLRELNVRRASIQSMPFGSKSFDVVTSIDVLYHLDVHDDTAALVEMRRVLKPNGILVLRVPANKYLTSAHDIHVHTARRYSKNELEQKLRQAGFKIKLISYVHSPIFPVSLIKIIGEKLTGNRNCSAVGKVNPIINKLLATVLKFEAWFIVRGWAMPFG